MKTKHTPQTKIALACLSLKLVSDDSVTQTTAPTDIQLTPVGRFRAHDGRPFDAPEGWYVDAQIGTHLAELAAQSQNDFVIDYEHQTLHKERNGQPAPAAGWFKHLEYREGSGLWAVGVKWTPQAEHAILNGQYRYISPVFSYEPQTGRLLAIKMAAITNSPGLDGMQDLASLTLDQFNHLQQEDVPMKSLLVKLGLSDSATEEQAVAALTVIQDQAKKATEAESQVAALTKQLNAEPDPAKFVPIDTVKALQGQLASLSAQVQTTSAEQAVEQAIKDGKLIPAQKDWAMGLAKSNLAALNEYLNGVNPIAALAQQQAPKGNQPEKTAALTAEQKQAAKALGIPEAEYLAFMKAEQGEQA